MVIYRVENKDGIGIYKGGHYLNSGLNWNDGNHPSIWANCGDISRFVSKLDYTEMKDYHVGCSSIDQLKHWFYDEIKLECVVKMGYQIKVLSVKTVICGVNQVLFNINDILETKALSVKDVYREVA